MEYLQEYYQSPAYGTPPNVLGTNVSIPLPRARPLQALAIEIQGVVTGALAPCSPEALPDCVATVVSLA